MGSSSPSDTEGASAIGVAQQPVASILGAAAGAGGPLSLSASASSSFKTQTPLDLLVKHGALKNLWSHGGMNTWSMEYLAMTTGPDGKAASSSPTPSGFEEARSAGRLGLETFTAGLWDHCYVGGGAVVESSTSASDTTSDSEQDSRDNFSEDDQQQDHTLITAPADAKFTDVARRNNGKNAPPATIHRLLQRDHGIRIPQLNPPLDTDQSGYAAHMRGWQMMQHRYGYAGNFLYRLIKDPRGRKRDQVPDKVMLVDSMMSIDPQWHLHRVENRLYIMIGELRNISHFTRWVFWLFGLLKSDYFVQFVRRERLKVFVMGTKFWHNWIDTLPHNNLLLDVALQGVLMNISSGAPYFTGAEFCNGGESHQCVKWTPGQQRPKKTGVSRHELNEIRYEYMGCFADDKTERAFEIPDGNFCFCTRKAMSIAFGTNYWATGAELELEEQTTLEYDLAQFPKVDDTECRVGFGGTAGCDLSVFGGACGGPFRSSVFRFMERMRAGDVAKKDNEQTNLQVGEQELLQNEATELLRVAQKLPLETIKWNDVVANLNTITFAVATGFYSRHRVKYVVQKARDGLGVKDVADREHNYEEHGGGGAAVLLFLFREEEVLLLKMELERAILVVARHGADVTNLVWMREDAKLLEVNFQQRCQKVKPYMWQTLDPYLDQLESPEEKIHFQISGDEGSHVFDRVLLQRHELGYAVTKCNETMQHGYYSEFAKTLNVGYEHLELPVDERSDEEVVQGENDPQGRLKYVDFYLPIEALEKKVGLFLEKRVASTRSERIRDI
eukprot:g1313.t1